MIDLGLSSLLWSLILPRFSSTLGPQKIGIIMLLRSFLTCVFALLLLSPYPSRGAESVHDFSRWEKEITAFEAKDKTDPPPTGALLFIGSSTIRLWDTLAQDFPDQKIIIRGFGGSQIVDATHFADPVIFPCQPKAV